MSSCKDWRNFKKFQGIEELDDIPDLMPSPEELKIIEAVSELHTRFLEDTDLIEELSLVVPEPSQTCLLMAILYYGKLMDENKPVSALNYEDARNQIKEHIREHIREHLAPAMEKNTVSSPPTSRKG